MYKNKNNTVDSNINSVCICIDCKEILKYIMIGGFLEMKSLVADNPSREFNRISMDNFRWRKEIYFTDMVS